MRTVIILRGVPGAGKSTLAAKEWPGAVVVSADKFNTDEQGRYAFRPSAHHDCLRSFVSLVRYTESPPSVPLPLQNHVPGVIVVDNTGTRVAEVAPYAALALAYGWEVRVVTLRCDPAVAAARNLHGVPAEKVAQMAATLEREIALMPRWWPHEVRDVG